jgi:hypothetical protein
MPDPTPLHAVPNTEPKKRDRKIAAYVDGEGDVHYTDVDRKIIDVNFSGAMRKLSEGLRTKGTKPRRGRLF